MARFTPANQQAEEMATMATLKELQQSNENLKKQLAIFKGRSTYEVERELSELREVVRRYQESIQQAQGLAGLNLDVYPKFAELRKDLKIGRYQYVARQLA
jgi:ribosome-binding protein aMBF1 (putative translation factor)